MHRFVKKIKRISPNKKLSFWTNNLKKFSSIYILLPPGAESGSFFKNLVNKFSDTDLLVAVDYPGRGSSTSTKKNDIKSLALEIILFLEAMKFKKKVILVGLSYGSAVAIEVARLNEKLVKEIILIAPGEYIPRLYHPLIRFIFLPALFSEKVRHKYRTFLMKILPSTFGNFPKRNLKDILQQWLGILDYKIDTSFQSELPCKIVAFSHDQIIRRGSILKVKKCFPNSLILLEIKDHHLAIETLSKQMLDSVF